MTALEQVNERIARAEGNKRAHTVAVELQTELNETREMLRRATEKNPPMAGMGEVVRWL